MNDVVEHVLDLVVLSSKELDDVIGRLNERLYHGIYL
jgi:hypothetical protein